VKDNGFILSSGEERLTKIMVNVPRWAPDGNYTGKLKITMLRP
jgi:hypothetical protein